MQHGAPLVPVFSFGQTDMYGYIRPFFDWPKGIVPKAAWSKFARKIGYAPLLMWGAFGTFCPKKVCGVQSAPLKSTFFSLVAERPFLRHPLQLRLLHATYALGTCCISLEEHSM